ncbi:MAG: cyclophilin-like fold protein [Oscillospiraceae bacterium]|nr:cyclophilin-like fold protein [Oscillospiraceae bacterium]
MKRIILLIIALMAMTAFPSFAGCSPGNGNENTSKSNRMKITVGKTTFTATLADNNTATEFKKLLPMTVSMTEHAGNEKFYDLSRGLPTDSSNPSMINNGDIMLFGSRTVVLFYKTFRTSYSYTRIGKVDNPSGLQDALGRGGVTVKFELIEEIK